MRNRIKNVVESCFQGKRIIIFSGGSAKNTEGLLNEIREIYNGGGFGFWNHNGEDLNATLINVTIENNTAQPGWFVGHGGGVWANNSNTVFQDCIIRNNTAGGNGGGINYFEGGWPELYNCVIDGNTSNAAGGGHLKVLQWLKAQGRPWDEEGIFACAAARGQLKVLQWLRAQGCPWDWRTCANAAGGGDLKVLQWAREQGCPWNRWTCSGAAGRGDLKVLQWAREQGCPWDKEECLDNARRFGHQHVVRWIKQQID